jgi:hypothetical protein
MGHFIAAHATNKEQKKRASKGSCRAGYPKTEPAFVYRIGLHLGLPDR